MSTIFGVIAFGSAIVYFAHRSYVYFAAARSFVHGAPTAPGVVPGLCLSASLAALTSVAFVGVFILPLSALRWLGGCIVLMIVATELNAALWKRIHMKAGQSCAPADLDAR